MAARRGGLAGADLQYDANRKHFVNISLKNPANLFALNPIS